VRPAQAAAASGDDGHLPVQKPHDMPPHAMAEPTSAKYLNYLTVSLSLALRLAGVAE
jgi:hypothetical protein